MKIEIKNLTKIYGNNKAVNDLLDNVTGRSVDVADDRFILVQQGV